MTRICFNVSGPSYPDNCFLLGEIHVRFVRVRWLWHACFFFFTSFFLFSFCFLFPRALTAFPFDWTSFVSRNGDQGESTILFCFFLFQKWNSYIVILLPSIVPIPQIYLPQCECIFCIPMSVMLIYFPTFHSGGFYPSSCLVSCSLGIFFFFFYIFNKKTH